MAQAGRRSWLLAGSALSMSALLAGVLPSMALTTEGAISLWTYALLLPVALLLARCALRSLGTDGLLGLGAASRPRSGCNFVPKIVDGAVFPYGVYTLQGKRPYQEDRFHVAPNLQGDGKATLYEVYDGHGGAAASQFCTEVLSDQLVGAPVNIHSRPGDALKHAFRKTDEMFLKQANIKNLDDGTTAIAVLALGTTLTVANAGDSRAIAVKSDGTFVPLSFDHKPDRSDERLRITKLGGSVVHWGVWRVEGILAVSRAIGDRLLKAYVIPDPEIQRWVCQEDDSFLVLASDGLWDVVRNDEVGRMLASCSGPQKAAELLAEEAYARGTADNVTVMVVDVRQSGRR